VILEETPLEGAYLIRRDRAEDARGSFERLWCTGELELHGLNGQLAQASLSINAKRGTLRGMHFQRPPAEEDKLVTCLRGAIYDVVVDIRRNSPTFGRWYSVRLCAEEPVSLYVSKGFAHGFLTLEDDTTILYQITQFYDPALSAGIRWDDPALAIEWPFEPLVVSDRDHNFPFLVGAG
jgi:dTDP-4-dehydrorhamnose 3,5-epimerase